MNLTHVSYISVKLFLRKKKTVSLGRLWTTEGQRSTRPQERRIWRTPGTALTSLEFDPGSLAMSHNTVGVLNSPPLPV